jgi:hypothetical protein
MKAALRSRLLTDAGIAALVGSRIAWAARPRRSELPSIALHLISAPRDYTMAGPSGLVNSRVQVDCWALTNAEADAVADAVNTALSGLRAEVNGVQFQGAFLENETDYTDDASAPDDVLARVSQDYSIWHSE